MKQVRANEADDWQMSVMSGTTMMLTDVNRRNGGKSGIGGDVEMDGRVGGGMDE